MNAKLKVGKSVVCMAVILAGISGWLKGEPPGNDGSEFSVVDDSLREVSGFKGTGPFTPLVHHYSIVNLDDEPLHWTAHSEFTGLSGMNGCLEVFPRTGTTHPGASSSIRVALTAQALELPAGEHAAVLSIHSPNSTSECPISISVADPARLLRNGGFEEGLDHWVVSGHVALATGPTYVPHEGAQVIAFNSSNSPNDGVVSQTIPTEAGVRYHLDFQLGTLSYNTNQQRLRLVATSATEPTLPALLDVTTVLNGAGGGATSWTSRHFEFIAAGPLTRVTFQDVSTLTASIDLLLDRVEVRNPAFGITVNTAVDENDGLLGMGAGDSLREAIAEAARIPGTNAILFAEPMNGSLCQLSNGQLLIDSDLAIDASALPSGIRISSGNSRLIESTSVCSLKDLTLTGGNDALESEAGGGAILNKHQMMIADSIIRQNSSNQIGGGIYSTGNLELLRCTIEENQSGGVGGGISTRYGSTHIGQCELSGNSALTNGGAMTCMGALGASWVMISNSALWNNSTNGVGGAYSGIGGYKQAGILHASNTTFTHNSAVEAGGAMTGPGLIELAQCTVHGNQASGPSSSGGGIDSANLGMRQSIVAGNTAPSNPNVSNCVIDASISNFVDGNPKLSDKGKGVLVPMSGSPVIDAALLPDGVPLTDQRGKPRVSGSAMDIGAVELQYRMVNTLIDENDGVGTGGISLRDAVNAQAADPVELIRFAPTLNGETIVLNQRIGSFLNDVSIDAGDLPDGIRISGNHQSGLFQFLWCTASLRNLTLMESNTAAIVIGDAYLELADSVIMNNHSPGSGGALNVMAGLSSVAVVKNCHFSGNTSDGSGGAVSNEGIVNISNSTFSNNHAELDGGAISSGAYRSGLRLINSTLTQNSAGMNGGALAAGSAQLVHNTITGNTALTGSGGGIYSGSTFDVPELGFTHANCIIAANTAATAPDIAGLINAAYGGNLVGMDPHLAPLDDYGSGIPVMPPLAGSPAIEGGVLLAETPLTDALGHPRPSGPLPDLGAVEAFAWSTLAMQDTDNDGIDDRLEPAYQMIVGNDDSTRDMDGDGCADAVELSNMTNPTDPSSKFEILAIIPAPGFDAELNPSFDITFSSFPGLRYSAECHSELDFGGPGTNLISLGTAGDFHCTRRLILRSGGDFLRLRRDP